MRDSTIERLPALSNATGIISRFDLLETVRLAQLLQPDLKDLVVITGSSAFDRSWEEAARRELAAFSSKLTITFLANLSLAALMARLASLPGMPAPPIGSAPGRARGCQVVEKRGVAVP